MNYSQRLNRVIPGGAHIYRQGNDQYSENAPQILERGEGAYIYTPEGKKFLDYGMALHSVTLGYGNPSVTNAAVKQIGYGNDLTRPSLIELQAAELMCNLIPSVEMVKFAKNESDVTTAALKIARAYTGRKYIARCAQHPFFSFDNWFIGNTPVTKGIPEEDVQFTLNFNYNDIQSLQSLFDKYSGQIAGVILEPATSEHPQNNFLQKAQEACHKNGAMFILDEMITGFRWHLSGAQAYYDIKPDLCIFGKSMANGFPVTAVGGKREIMNVGGIKEQGAERVFLLSTMYGAEMYGLGAFVETIHFYKEHHVIDHLWSYGEKLTNGMNTIAKEMGLEKYFEIYGIPCSPNYMTKDKNDEVSMGLRTLFFQEMIKNGVLMPCIAISYAHGEIELQRTLEATRKALMAYAKGLDEGYEKYQGCNKISISKI
ncbi:MAG: glutamate-1-semialdehyde 2,1-aminomutase [Prevotella sp.]|jgi:glutamate-1-semialdehyde 2,1-aminomutase|nr:glutamate-1-semialdehyde 2,1-aminomutase [Prevotella sp.]